MNPRALGVLSRAIFVRTSFHSFALPCLPKPMFGLRMILLGGSVSIDRHAGIVDCGQLFCELLAAFFCICGCTSTHPFVNPSAHKGRRSSAGLDTDWYIRLLRPRRPF